jgi:putative ABC transport system permease protein
MLKNYFLTAYKVFMRRKLFTFINLLCIVLTLVVLMVFTALIEHAVSPSGVEGRSERFVQIVMSEWHRADDSMISRQPLGYRLIDQYLRKLPHAEKVAAVTGPQPVAVYQKDRVTRLDMRRADAEYWEILDFTVLEGRVPSKDDVANGRFVATINATTAKRLFGDEPAVGQKINAGGQHFEVIGVVKDEMHINAFADMWVPVTTYASTTYRQELAGEFMALLMARSPADVPALRSEVAAAAKQVQMDDPKQWGKMYIWGDTKIDLFARLLTNSKELDSGAGVVLAIIAAIMLVFMTLPALNLINLNAGRILERSSEIGVRKAFGATNRQLALQFVTENVLLSLAGGLVGLGCAQLALMWIESTQLIPYLSLKLNLAVFSYGMLIAAVFGLLSGVIPALRMARLDPVNALKGAA